MGRRTVAEMGVGVKTEPQPHDVVIHATERMYLIRTFTGELLDRTDDGVDAMKRACAAAQVTGGYVWIRSDESPEKYHEVVCP
jgi:hypothetical protein